LISTSSLLGIERICPNVGVPPSQELLAIGVLQCGQIPLLPFSRLREFLALQLGVVHLNNGLGISRQP
jgi:hypothetical protein